MKIFKRAIVTVAVIGTMFGAAAPAFAADNNAPQDGSKPGSMCAKVFLWESTPKLCAPLL